MSNMMRGCISQWFLSTLASMDKSNKKNFSLKAKKDVVQSGGLVVINIV
jgi:hypothetical protein